MITELDRFLMGDRYERRKALLIRRLEREALFYRTKLASPLTPEEYNRIDSAYLAISASIIYLENYRRNQHEY